MKKSRMLSSIVVIFLSLLICVADCVDPLGNFCNKATEIGAKSKLAQNIKSLLPELARKASKTGYAVSSSGDGKDRAYGLAQCRRDVSTSDCSDCLTAAASEIRTRCPNEADARIWYDYCFLRHDRAGDFVGKVDTSSFALYYFNVENVTETSPESFNAKLGALMGRIRKEAVRPGGGGLGKGDVAVSDFSTLYGLGQCTGDLAPVNCAQCLAIAVGNLPKFCADRRGCRVLYSSCYLRYELYPFFFPLAASDQRQGQDRHGTTVVRG